MVVLDRQWPLAQRFSDAVEQKLKSFPHYKPYYVGTADRMAAVKANCPSTRIIGANNFHFVPDVDAEGGGGSYMLLNEVFGPAIAFKYVDGGNDAVKFWKQTSAFCNSSCFGSLSMSVVVSPSTVSAVGKNELDLFIRDLKWGTIGVNVWAAFITGNPFGTWGAVPGRHSEEDIQSGIGTLGNLCLLENFEKSLIRGQWCDPMIVKLLTPGAGNSFMKAFGTFSVSQSVSDLLVLLKNAFF